MNDRNNRIWQKFGASVWPTIVVLSPRGQILFKINGEGYTEFLTRLLSEAISFYQQKQAFDATMALQLGRDAAQSRRTDQLRFPSKLCVDAKNRRIFVSDSGNHRIVILDLDTLKHIVALDSAQLRSPNGVVWDAKRQILYVAGMQLINQFIR